MNKDEFNFKKGKMLKELGMALALSDEDQDIAKIIFKECLLRIASKGEPFTSDDIYKCVIGNGIDAELVGNAAGAIFNGFAKQGFIKKTGNFKLSTRVSNHAHIQQEWIRT